MKKYIKTANFHIEETKKQGLIAPIQVRLPNGKEAYLISGETSREYRGLDNLLEKIPFINILCISTIYKARK